MKNRKKAYAVIVSVVSLLFFTGVAIAKIDFKTIEQTRIDIEKITIEKKHFFSFITGIISKKRFGLGNYGRVSFSPCDIKINDRKLIEYRTLKGLENKYLSNPSCDQTVIRKVLEKNYNYRSNNLTRYQSRKCIMTIEKVFSPLLEYYTIQHEEKRSKDCRSCDAEERGRLNKILNIQKKIADNCHEEREKVLNFLSDLDNTVDRAYRLKNTSKK